MKQLHQAIRGIIAAVNRVERWLERCRIRVYAAQASFFMIISALPMLLLILTLAGLFLPREGGDLFDSLLARLPSELTPLAGRILSEVEAKANPSVLSLSAVTLFWSASRGVRGIGAGVRNVYGGKKDGNFIVYALKSLIYTLMYIVSVILALIVWVFGDTILAHAEEGTPIGFLKLLNSGAFFLLLTTVFLLTYRGFSGRRMTLISQLPGALFSALGWLLYSFFFEFYVENYGSYSYVYGSLASLVVVMLWLYSCMEILLVGAGLNHLLYRRVKIV